MYFGKAFKFMPIESSSHSCVSSENSPIETK